MKDLFRKDLQDMQNWSPEKLQQTYIVITMIEEKIKSDKSAKYKKEDLLQIKEAKNIIKKYMIQSMLKENS